MVDYGSKLLKAGIASPDQDPPCVSDTYPLSLNFSIFFCSLRSVLKKCYFFSKFWGLGVIFSKGKNIF